MGQGVFLGGQFSERQLEREGGLRALILVRAVVVQAVAAAARGGIVKGNAKVVAAEEPLESATRLAPPEAVVGRAECFEAGGDHGLGFDRLLVKDRAGAVPFMEAIAADRAEMTGRGVLVASQPAQAFEACLKSLRMGHHAAADDQCLAEAGVVIGDAGFEPGPCVVGAVVPAGEESFHQ